MAIEHYQRYQFARELVKGKLVLDAACGDGYGSSILAETAEKVYGLDLDVDVVKTANQKYGKNHLEYVAGSVASLPFQDAMFDVVISFETIEHVDKETQEKFLEEIKRVLKPDGIMIMSTPNKAIYTDLVKGENKFHVKEFYAQEFVTFIERKFANVEYICQYPSVGYFLTKEKQEISVSNPTIQMDHCRYVIAIASDGKNFDEVELDNTVQFDDSMYYFLNMRAHELEKTLVDMKIEVDAFEKQQENEIIRQKEYIEKLERDIIEQKEYIANVDLVINEQQKYIAHLEKDIKELKDYIENIHK